MQASLLVSIIAIILSSFSIVWQIFTYWDLKRNKIKITIELEHKEGERFNAIQDCFIRFYILNIGRNKILITSIEPEYLVMEQSEILSYYFTDNIDTEFPFSIDIDEYYLQKILIEWEKKLEVISILSDGPERWKTDRYTAQKVRIVVKDIHGKRYYSDWVDYKDTWLKEGLFNSV